MKNHSLYLGTTILISKSIYYAYSHVRCSHQVWPLAVLFCLHKYIYDDVLCLSIYTPIKTDQCQDRSTPTCSSYQSVASNLRKRRSKLHNFYHPLRAAASTIILHCCSFGESASAREGKGCWGTDTPTPSIDILRKRAFHFSNQSIIVCKGFFPYPMGIVGSTQDRRAPRIAPSSRAPAYAMTSDSSTSKGEKVRWVLVAALACTRVFVRLVGWVGPVVGLIRARGVLYRHIIHRLFFRNNAILTWYSLEVLVVSVAN